MGEGRVVVVLITSGSNGTGSIGAYGCADGLTVSSGATTEVRVDMSSGSP